MSRVLASQRRRRPARQCDLDLLGRSRHDPLVHRHVEVRARGELRAPLQPLPRSGARAQEHERLAEVRARTWRARTRTTGSLCSRCYRPSSSSLPVRTQVLRWRRALRRVPLVRERCGDLVHHFLRRHGGRGSPSPTERARAAHERRGVETPLREARLCCEYTAVPCRRRGRIVSAPRAADDPAIGCEILAERQVEVHGPRIVAARDAHCGRNLGDRRRWRQCVGRHGQIARPPRVQAENVGLRNRLPKSRKF